MSDKYPHEGGLQYCGMMKIENSFQKNSPDLGGASAVSNFSKGLGFPHRKNASASEEPLWL